MVHGGSYLMAQPSAIDIVSFLISSMLACISSLFGCRAARWGSLAHRWAWRATTRIFRVGQRSRCGDGDADGCAASFSSVLRRRVVSPRCPCGPPEAR